MLYTIIEKQNTVKEFLITLFSFHRGSQNRLVISKHDYATCAITYLDENLEEPDDLEDNDNSGCGFRTIYDIHKICIVHYPELTLEELGQILGDLCKDYIFTYDFCDVIRRIVFKKLPVFYSRNWKESKTRHLSNLTGDDEDNLDCTFEEFCELLNLTEYFPDENEITF